MNVTNILCPVDFSISSDSALAYASSIAKEYDAELHIVHIYEEPFAYAEPTTFVPPADMQPDRERLEKTRPDSPDVRFRHEFIVGHPADKLVDYANKYDIDLIVMGTHGRTGISRLLMGSVAEAIVRRAPCPVLTIKQPAVKLQEA